MRNSWLFVVVLRIVCGFVSGGFRGPEPGTSTAAGAPRRGAGSPAGPGGRCPAPAPQGRWSPLPPPPPPPPVAPARRGGGGEGAARLYAKDRCGMGVDLAHPPWHRHKETYDLKIVTNDLRKYGKAGWVGWAAVEAPAHPPPTHPPTRSAGSRKAQPLPFRG